MKAKIAKLIDVKSIMTLLLTIVFCALALCGVISGEQFLTIFVTVVGFYFGTQSMKKAEDTPAVQQYTGPAQSVADSTEYEGKTVDAATTNEVHPPDQDDVTVTGFAG